MNAVLFELIKALRALEESRDSSFKIQMRKEAQKQLRQGLRRMSDAPLVRCALG